MKPIDSLPARRLGDRCRLASAAVLALGLSFGTPCAGATFDCGVSSPGLAFGNYDVFSAAVTNGTANLSVNCSLDTGNDATVSYTLSLSPGGSGNFAQRQMTNGVSNTLSYNLYTSNTYSVVWGDGSGSTATVSGSIQLSRGNSSQTNNSTVYGRVPALQDVAVGPYQDTVTVTLTF